MLNALAQLRNELKNACWAKMSTSIAVPNWLCSERLTVLTFMKIESDGEDCYRLAVFFFCFFSELSNEYKIELVEIVRHLFFHLL